MAHFLEHLVFKGGEKYPTYNDVNETAERLGGMLNAYTSHDLVAFHITVRAESAPEAIDLLTDFVARPRLDAEELDRERGVVIQEINRAYDQPSTVAEYLIDRAAFGDHPLGRTVLGPEENLRAFTREAIVAFRERRWAGGTAARFWSAISSFCPRRQLEELFSSFPRSPRPSPTCRPRRSPRDVGRAARHQPVAPADDLPARGERHRRRARAALSIYSTLLGGSMGSRLFEEIREKRGLCYSVYAIAHAYADVPILQLGSGLDSAKCVEAYSRMREIVDELRAEAPPRRRSTAPAHTPPDAWCSPSRTPAPSRAMAASQDRLREDIDPTPRSPRSTRSRSMRS